MKRVIVAVLSLAMLLVILPGQAFAHNGEDHATEREARQHEASTKLDDTKKRACEIRAQNITAIMARSVFRAQNHGKLLATLTERLKNFAKTVDGRTYATDSIDAIQAKFNNDFTTLQAAAVFSCDGDNPGGQIRAFQELNRVVMKDIKEWRLALRDFVSFLKQPSGESQE